jgi:hypothetical protein
MSADYGTEHFKGYGHLDMDPPYIHVVMRAGEAALGNFDLAEIGELVQLAGQAWPAATAVEVRYVIETRRRYDGTGSNPHPWTLMWSALADEEQDHGVSEDYARTAFDGFCDDRREWRLLRRTTVAADEPLDPKGD